MNYTGNLYYYPAYQSYIDMNYMNYQYEEKDTQQINFLQDTQQTEYPKKIKIQGRNANAEQKKQQDNKIKPSSNQNQKSIPRYFPNKRLLRSEVKDCEIIQFEYNDPIYEEILAHHSKKYSQIRATISDLMYDEFEKLTFINAKKKKIRSRLLIKIDE